MEVKECRLRKKINNKINDLMKDKEFYKYQFDKAINRLDQYNIDRYSSYIMHAMYGIDLLKELLYSDLKEEMEMKTNEKDTKENNI